MTAMSETTVNNCGHWAQFEYADEFNRIVGDFISR